MVSEGERVSGWLSFLLGTGEATGTFTLPKWALEWESQQRLGQEVQEGRGGYGPGALGRKGLVPT